MLCISDAGLRFDETVLCQHLSFEIAPAQIGLLMAPSGAGKSTLLKWIAGIKVAGLTAHGSITLNAEARLMTGGLKKDISAFCFNSHYYFPI